MAIQAISGKADYTTDELRAALADERPERAFLMSSGHGAEACARPDCPAGGGSGVGCEECRDWWDGERRQHRA